MTVLCRIQGGLKTVKEWWVTESTQLGESFPCSVGMQPKVGSGALGLPVGSHCHGFPYGTSGFPGADTRRSSKRGEAALCFGKRLQVSAEM